MALETGTYVQDLVSTNPTTADFVSQGDDHLRLIKTVLEATFPNASKAFYFPGVSASKVAADSPVTVAVTDENDLFRANATSGAITFNLPAAATAGAGFEVGFVKTDSSANAVTIDGNSSETIGGSATLTLTKQNQSLVIRSDGTNWQVMSAARMGALSLLDSIDTAELTDNGVTLAKMAHGTQGDLIYMAASGAPTYLAAGTAGHRLKTGGAAANPSWAADAFGGQLLHVTDEKIGATEGGSFSSGAWRTRTLQTEETNEITSATLVSNQITLPAGTYMIDAWASAYRVASHKCRWYNITDGSTVINGSTERSADDAGTAMSASKARGRFTIAGTTVFELQHRCETSNATSGFGNAAGLGAAEVYAEVMIWKVS